MAEPAPIEVTNLDRYGAAALEWSRAREGFGDTNGQDIPYFLGTVRPDGRPHAAGIGAVWHDGEVYFVSGPGTRKSRNLAVNPACTINARLKDIDVVLEGTAVRVVDAALLQRVAAVFRAGGWPAEVEGDSVVAPYSAPSAGPPPWYVYRLVLRTAFGVATAEPSGATRWRFAE